MLNLQKQSKTIFLLFFLFLSSLLHGQTYYPKNDSSYYHNHFYKQLTSWNWQGELNVYSGQRESWNWHLHEHYQSNLLIPAQGKKQWKDENTTRGLLFFNNSFWDYGFYLRSWYQNDEQSTTDNEFGNQILGLFTTFRYEKDISITPYAGMQHSKNRKYIDWGWDVGLKGKVKSYKLGDYNMSAQFDSDFDIYDKRQNFDNEFHIGANTKFNQYTSDSISFSFSEMNKEYYDSNPNQKKIIEVNILSRNLQNSLHYNLSSINRFTILTKIQSRKLDFISDRNIFLIDNQFKFAHYGSQLFYHLSLRTNDETQDNTEIRTNNRTRQTIMKFEADYQLDAQKTFEIDFAYAKLQYDTPDISNTEDRDEQRYIVELGYDQRFSEYLSMEWTLYTYFYHKIYLSSQQSQNNNWNRVIILNPTINYNYGKIRNSLDTKILANYTVYDFEELFTKTRSFIFRKYSLADSLIYQVYGRIRVGIFTRIELVDKGNFFQDNWTQHLVQSYHSYFYNLFIENNNIFGFNIRLGYTYYDHVEWRHLPAKMRYREITNSGPYVSARYNLTGKTIFAAYVSLSSLDDSVVGSTNYSTGSLRMNYLF